MQRKLNPMIPALAAVTLALGLSACDRAGEDRTVGEKLDSAVATAERKTDQAGAQLSEATDAGAVKLKDAAITTGVNADLAADATLSAMKIDVDTTNGAVRLTGTAPTEAARERATQIAKQRDGVQSVDNQLQVRP